MSLRLCDDMSCRCFHDCIGFLGFHRNSPSIVEGTILCLSKSKENFTMCHPSGPAHFLVRAEWAAQCLAERPRVDQTLAEEMTMWCFMQANLILGKAWITRIPRVFVDLCRCMLHLETRGWIAFSTWHLSQRPRPTLEWRIAVCIIGNRVAANH